MYRTTVRFAALFMLSITTHAYAQGQTTGAGASAQNTPASSTQPATAPPPAADPGARASAQLAASPAAHAGQTTTMNLSCTVGTPPKNFSCGPERVLVDIDPSPKVCWTCLPKVPPTE